jgi:uncharacterized damage-inducible protein DinB
MSAPIVQYSLLKQNTIMPYTLISHLNYSVWATAKLVEIIETADESILKIETPSSFSTIEKTILHIWDAELVWLKRLQGESLTEWPSNSFTGDSESLIAGWVDNAVTLRDFVESKDEDYLTGTIEYKNMQGKSFTNTVEEIIYHVVNHGTFHRGQIVTMLRANNFTDIESTDLITYLRAVAI